jgi:hypothetical protein
LKKACQLCKSASVETLIDFGPQPICNRFPRTTTEPEALFPMVLEQCHACGLLQTTQPVPADELRPRVDWITYNEPEGHLDELAGKLARLPGVKTFAGITFKDDTLLRRMKQRGFSVLWRLDPAVDLGVTERGVGAETIQDRLTPAKARQIAAARGKVDVLSVRHIFEHTHRTLEFVSALRELVNPGGYVLFEIPDCDNALELYDYSTMWEEHTIYFTPGTYRQAFGQCGLALTLYERFPYTLENCLVGVARVETGKTETADVEHELARGQRFARQFAAIRAKYQELFPKPAAMFGAGHLAATFINLLGLKDRFQFAVDDNPNKRGLYMPGSKLPITGSAELATSGIKLCLMSVAVESEEKVIAKNQAFVEAGGQFASIFPASKHALKL